MRHDAKGQGRKPSQGQARQAADKAFDAKMTECSRDTGAPRPSWMLDPSKLPKAPPRRPA